MKKVVKISFEADLENQGLARNLLSAYLVNLDPTVDEITELKTALSEAVGNAIIHGYEKRGKGEIQLMFATLDEASVMVKIQDQGVGIQDVEKAKEPLYSTLDAEECSGMGFTIMESFVDKVFVRSKPGQGTTVTLIKQLKQYDE